jgi:hypothetical protein
MNAESKCNCQHCNGHIAFPTEMAGQSINCPHCQLETLLFITPATVPQKQSSSVRKINKLGLVAALAVVAFSIWFLISTWDDIQHAITGPIKIETNIKPQKRIEENASNLPQQTNLKPVIGAFGWKLGDQLPQRLKAEVRETDYLSMLLFTPETEWPPFNSFSLNLTPDGRICAIQATAVIFDGAPEDFDTAKQRVVSLLTEKYGLRLHSHPDAPIEDAYEFGTADQSVRLQTLRSDNNKQLWLEYYDEKLERIADYAHAAARAKDENEKKAALSKGL